MHCSSSVRSNTFRVTAGLQRALTTVGVAALFTLCLSVGSARRAEAQALSSFSLYELSSNMIFNVNGTNMNGKSDLDLNPFLATGFASKNSLDVGFATPQGSLIKLVYTGASPMSAFGKTFNTGDFVNVFGIGAVYLTNENGVNADHTQDAHVINKWGGGAFADDWGSDSGTGYVGYTHGTGWSPNDDWMAYKANDNHSGKDWTAAGNTKPQYGNFTFNGLNSNIGTVGNSPTYLGMDVIVDAYNADGTLKSGGTALTGRVRLDSAVGGSAVVPEGSSIALMGAGLLPLLGGMFAARKRGRKSA